MKGHVIPLTFDCAHLTRGSRSNKMVLYPPEDVVPALAQSSTPCAFRDAGLVLCDAILDPRFVIWDLDTTILEVSLIILCSGCYIHAAYHTYFRCKCCSIVPLKSIQSRTGMNASVKLIDGYVGLLSLSKRVLTSFVRYANSRLRLLWNLSTMSWLSAPTTIIQG